MRETVASIGHSGHDPPGSEINGVIDEIASDQPAGTERAVEAAHASEAGKGFAVVSPRSASSPSAAAGGGRDPRSDRAHDRTDRRVGIRVHDVSIALDSVVHGISDVADRLRGIAGSSAQQSAGLSEVSRGVQGLDEITRQNADMVNASARSSQALVFQAAALGDRSPRFDCVTAAPTKHSPSCARPGPVAEIGWEQASREISDPEGEFHDRDMSVYVLDLTGKILAYSAARSGSARWCTICRA
jgi:hypothetical protein